MFRSLKKNKNFKTGATQWKILVPRFAAWGGTKLYSTIEYLGEFETEFENIFKR
jgi:predicted secreted protein